MSISKERITFIAILLGLFVVPVAFWYWLTTGKNNYKTLPVYGPKEVAATFTNGVADTIYHTLPEFTFTDWTGKTVTTNDLKNKIFVADFFFTTCKTICPKMSKGLADLQVKYNGDTIVKFISYTVDPATDSVEQLKTYATQMGAKPGVWYLVTGDKKQIYDLARTGYFLPVQDGVGDEADFIHSEKLVLMDHKQRIRGFFDGTDPWEVDSLKDAIKLLKYEQAVDLSKSK